MKKINKKHIEATRFWAEENEQGLTKTAVAKLFGSDRHQIEKLKDVYQDYIASCNPDDKEYMFLFSQQEYAAIKEYSDNQQITKKEILEKYHIGNTRTLDNWLSIFGIAADRHYKYNFNRDIFKGEITPDKAYWLGFLLADGYIGFRKNNRSVELHLSEKDRQHLVKFAHFVGVPENMISQSIKKSTGGAYTKDNTVYRFGLYSDSTAADLEKFHIVPNKSLKEKPYIFDDDILQLNYIRGIIDGDGYITNPKNKNKRIGVCGSKEVCQYISSFFKSRYPDIFISEAHRRHEKLKNPELELWTWYSTNKDALSRVLNDLYIAPTTSTYLDRKYNNACAVLKLLD